MYVSVIYKINLLKVVVSSLWVLYGCYMLEVIGWQLRP